MPKTEQNLTLFAAQDATSTAPTTATDGVDLGRMRYPNEVVCVIHNTAAGTSGNTITCRAWGYHPATEFWYPLGTDATSAANKGLLNEGAAMTITGGTAANDVRHAEIISGLRGFSRLFIQVTAIAEVTATCVIATRDLGNR